MQSTEEWRPVVGYEGRYEVSNHGRVRSLDRYARAGKHSNRLYRGKMLRLIRSDETGRVSVGIHKDGKHRTRLVHHLVLEAFIGPRPRGTEGCHWDGDASNNRASNLRWDTHIANEHDKRRHGTHNNTAKTHCPRGHILADPNLVPGEAAKGYRKCRACTIATASAFKRGVPLTQEDADARYMHVMAGGADAEQHACKRGHRLTAPNLGRAAMKDGHRACRACSQARGYADYRGIPFDPAIADEKYRLIMDAAA